MRLEAFLDKFEVPAEMPGGIPAMRELALEMAVRGSLTDRGQADHEDAARRSSYTNSTIAFTHTTRAPNRRSTYPTNGDGCRWRTWGLQRFATHWTTELLFRLFRCR